METPKLSLHGTSNDVDIHGTPSDILPINEIFYGVEGEGFWIGSPQVFCRVDGCLVGCKNCDSVHTWTLKKSRMMSLESVISEIKSVAAGRTNRVSITGGEPMHYKDALLTLIPRLHDEGYKVSLETSGYLLHRGVFIDTDRISLDIKTPSSGVATPIDWIFEIIKIWKCCYCQVKCVIDTEEDMNWVIANVIPHIPSNRTLVLTPCAGPKSTAASISSRVQMMLSMMKPEYPVVIIPQIHVLLGLR